MRETRLKVIKLGFGKILIAFFLFGIIMGVLFANFFSPTYAKEYFLFDQHYFSFLQSMDIDCVVVFQLALVSYIKEFCFLILLSITIIGTPILLLHDMYKGFLVGFLISTATMQFGLKGVLYFFACLFPQYIILAPLYLFVYMKGHEIQGLLYQQHGFRKSYLMNYIPMLMVLLCLITLGSFLEGFLNTEVMKRIIEVLI